jgi:hypothetical protein
MKLNLSVPKRELQGRRGWTIDAGTFARKKLCLSGQLGSAVNGNLLVGAVAAKFPDVLLIKNFDFDFALGYAQGAS